MLRDINDRAWLPLVGFSGWSETKFAVSATEAYNIVAGLWFRLVYTFSKWPWRLAKAFDLGAPREERFQICEDLLRCDPEHLEPGLARPIRGLVTTADELVDSGEVRLLVMNTFKKVGSHNIGNENRFARQKRFARLSGREGSGEGRSCLKHSAERGVELIVTAPTSRQRAL